MLRQKLQEDQLQALKNKDTVRLNTLRFILSQIKNREIEKKAELSDEETMAALRKFAKELRESIDAFTKGNRSDLVAEYQKQLDIVAAYLPAELSDSDLEKKIKEIIANNQEIYNKNPKAIIGVCMRELKGLADGQRIMKAIGNIE